MIHLCQSILETKQIYLHGSALFRIPLKAPFLMKKHWHWNLRHTLVEKLLKINATKYYREVPSLAQVGALQVGLYVKLYW